MSNIQGRLLKNSKGVTILEMLISLSIASIICSMVLPVFFYIGRFYNRSTNIEKSWFSACQGMLYIDSCLQEDVTDVQLDNNKLKILFSDGSNKEIYFVKSGSIGTILVCSENYKGKFVNNVVKNISDFKAEVNRNLVYITIQTSDGRKYIRCFGVELMK